MLAPRFRPLPLAITVLVAIATPAHAAAPTLAARAWILVNPEGDVVLASRNADTRLPMASTTKMMTSLVAVQTASANRRVLVPSSAVTVGESSAGLVAGEQLRVSDLLKGTLIASGNDAATALAITTAGSVPAFVARMNARARRMGLRNTHFANPHGLDAPGHYSSVRDLVRIGEELMTEPRLRTLVGQRRATIPGPYGVGSRRLVSHNTLLDTNPDVDGIKTGQTRGAGYSIVVHAARASLGVELYAAVIGTGSEAARATETDRLLRWGFRQYGRATVVRSGTPVMRVPVRDRPGTWVTLNTGGTTLATTLRLGHRTFERVEIPRQVVAPVDRGEVLGRVVIRQDGRVLGTRPLVAADAVGAPGLVDRFRAGIGALLP